MALSTCIILFLLFARQILSPLLQLRVNSPIPFEFFVMVFACFMSQLLDMKDKYQVETITFMKKGSVFLILIYLLVVKKTVLQYGMQSGEFFNAVFLKHSVFYLAVSPLVF